MEMVLSSSVNCVWRGGKNQSSAGCLVDGCNADLRLCREYHRRHTVCETHSKTAKVTIGGQDQLRFCQQCSRFHSLIEFDKGKRNCRKRLDGHNRRRRKPQPQYGSPHLSTKYINKNNPSSGQQAATSRLTPQNIVSSFSINPINTDDHHHHHMLFLCNNDNNMQLNNNYSSSFPVPHHNTYETINRHHLLTSSSQQYAGASSGFNMFLSSSDNNNRLNEDVVDRALSLLSSAPGREFGLIHHQPHDHLFLSQYHNMQTSSNRNTHSFYSPMFQDPTFINNLS